MSNREERYTEEYLSKLTKLKNTTHPIDALATAIDILFYTPRTEIEYEDKVERYYPNQDPKYLLYLHTSTTTGFSYVDSTEEANLVFSEEALVEIAKIAKLMANGMAFHISVNGKDHVLCCVWEDDIGLIRAQQLISFYERPGRNG